MKGLPISIFSNPRYRKCANGGLSEFHNEALVIGEGIPEVFEANGLPVLKLVKGNLPGLAKLVPADAGDKWVMFGGNYAGTSDSRFTKAVEKITGSPFSRALPIHDRIE